MADNPVVINPLYSLYSGDIAAAANANGVPVEILSSLVYQESKFDQSAIGSSGEVGLTQLMPATVKALGINPYDAKQNINGGAKWLKQAYDATGNWKDALATYNSGKTYAKAPQARTRTYTDSILNNATAMGYNMNNTAEPSGVVDGAIEGVKTYVGDKIDGVKSQFTGAFDSLVAKFSAGFEWLANNTIYLIIGICAILLVAVSAWSLI